MENNLYIKIRNFFEKREMDIIEGFKKLNINKEKLEELLKIERLRQELCFRECDYPINFKDYVKSHSNGYSDGLYNGSKQQNEFDINAVLKIILKGINNSIDIENSLRELRLLVLLKEINYILYANEDYDINIAIKGEHEVYDCMEDHYIIATKNDIDTEFNFIYIDFKKVDQEYSPTQEEFKKINEEYEKLIKQ